MPNPLPLTDEQIDALFEFVKKKYVDYYDVQLELVDHLASEIEQRQAASPDITFDAALQRVYQGFGIFGFTEVIEEKAKAINQMNRLLFWKAIKRLFVLPNVIGSLVLSLVLFIAFDQLTPSTFLAANGVLALLAALLSVYYFFKKNPRKEYKLLGIQYNGVLHFGATLNLYLTYYIGYVWLLPSLEGTWLLMIPFSCWLGWINFTAGAVAYEKLLHEQRKLYPLAFA
ncbi:hypothetical protein [Salmonirosea aquatica]|uniref:Uncharacterized protein n=1 Tax=Salmonirosea aquatica TaxID=2654236 RepID=A0A7C9F8Z1_9BACT|nr:hypothetical protein [Cytophagaceae bacterium SJW1-29]